VRKFVSEDVRTGV